MNNTIFKKKFNDIELYYEYYSHPSSHETIVLLHGFLSSTFSFRKIIPLLKENYNVISIDVPPFGKSGKSTHFKYSYKNIANTIIILLEKLAIRHPILIGHSLGGQICLNILYLFPNLVKKAILLCSSGYLKRSKKHLILSSYIPFSYLFVKHYLGKSGLERNLKNVVYDHRVIDEEMRLGYLNPFLKNDIFKALTLMIRHREEDLSGSMLQTIQTPCLLIWGENDKVVPLRTAQRLKKDLPNSKLVILKNTGHLVPEERPLEVTQLVNKFIAP